MEHNVFHPPKSNVESDQLSEQPQIVKFWSHLNKVWFFSTVATFTILGVISSHHFEELASRSFIDFATSLTFIVAGIWWVVLDQFERDSETPTLLIAGMVLVPIVAFPIHCYWSRGLLGGSLQLLKLFAYVAICFGAMIGTTAILNLGVA